MMRTNLESGRSAVQVFDMEEVDRQPQEERANVGKATLGEYLG
jgi:hypothetical protein